MRKTILTAALTLLLPAAAFAEGFENVSVRSDMYVGKVMISGAYQSDVESRWITSVVTDQAGITQDNLQTAALGAIQVTVGENGAFSGEIVLPESVPTGEYALILVPEFGEQYRVSFQHNSRGEINTALKEINAKANGMEMIQAIISKKDVLKIDTDFLSADGFEQNSYAPILVNCKPENGWDTVKALETAMKTAKALYDVNAAQTEAQLDQALEAYSAVTGFPWKEYSELYQTIKTAVATDIIKENNFTKPSELDSLYQNLRVIRSITAAPNWSYSKYVLSEESFQKKLSDSAKKKLAVLTYPEDVYKNVYTNKGNITDITSVLRVYESAIDTVYSSEQTNTRPGGGGGGGTGGSGNDRGQIVAPAVPTKTDDQNQQKPFSDLDGVEWAREAIEYLAEKNVVSGTGSNTFSPNDPVTREQFVKMLVDALGFDESTEIHFSDADQNMWYYPYLQRAYAAGIAEGIGEGRFGVGNHITRQDLAAMIYRAASKRGLQSSNAVVDYADADQISDYAKEAVAAMQSLGIISGMENHCFNPIQNATRAQAAKIIYGVMLALQ